MNPGCWFLARRPLPVCSGTTAAIMTTKSLTQEVNGRSDLAGKKVGTWEDYVAKLQGEGISAIPFKWWVDRGLQSARACLRAACGARSDRGTGSRMTAGPSRLCCCHLFCRDVTADEEKMLDALATGRIIALVMDTNFVTYTAGQNVSYEYGPPGAVDTAHVCRLAGLLVGCAK